MGLETVMRTLSQEYGINGEQELREAIEAFPGLDLGIFAARAKEGEDGHDKR